VGDVRGLGLFTILELVKDRETKEPLAPWNAKPHEMGVMAKLPGLIRELGMFTFVRWNWIFAVPPLCVNEAELREGLDIIDKVLDVADGGL
jgi:taurine--2-oxoglutarate transaminase